MEFNDHTDVNLIFTDWEKKPYDDRLKIVRALKERGKVFKSEVVEDLGSNTTDVCYQYQHALIKPCSLEECSFYVNCEKHKNCVHLALASNKHAKYPAADIASLLKVSISDVNRITNLATNKLRKEYLKEKLDRHAYPRYDYIDHHCVNCGVSLHEEFEVKGGALFFGENDQYAHCSKKCLVAFPAWKFYIEEFFRCNYKEVLGIASQFYREMKILADLFGTSVDNIEHELKE